MSGPDFDELVGGEGSPEELARLRRAHDLIVTAGAPPELSPRLADAPQVSDRAPRIPRRRRGTAFLLAAGIAAMAFGIGFLIGGRGSGDFPSNSSPIAMHPPSASGSARGSILVGEKDAVGNWPLLLRVNGLEPLERGEYYELYLTRNGKVRAWCGAFSVDDDRRTEIRFSVPYRLKGAGWVVTTSMDGPKGQTLLTT